MVCDNCKYCIEQWHRTSLLSSTGISYRKYFCNNRNSLYYNMEVKNVAKCDSKDKENTNV